MVATVEPGLGPHGWFMVAQAVSPLRLFGDEFALCPGGRVRTVAVADGVARKFHQSGRLAFRRDFAAWTAKAAICRIMRIGSDGPFHKIRGRRRFRKRREEAAERRARVDGACLANRLQPAPGAMRGRR